VGVSVDTVPESDRASVLGNRTWLRRLGWSSLLANIAIVLTGGAVRLTESGLGCPTWPRCTDRSFTPHGALDHHSAIEFGNRTLTFVLTAIAIATFVTAWQSGRRDLRRLSILMALGVPAQALIGGVTVLTDLNPWVVSCHLLVSLAIISVAVLYLHRIDVPASSPEQRLATGAARGPHVTLAWSAFAAAWVVLYLGTVVTGSGPHAGDVKAPRNGLDPLQLSQLHTDFVFLLVGLTVALVVMHPSRATWTLLVVELAQGLVGFVQYFTDLPVILVGFHLLGASLVAAAVAWVVIEVREGSGRSRPRSRRRAAHAGGPAA
jgi:cytochrome c oxidase assembly protein subunit 15